MNKRVTGLVTVYRPLQQSTAVVLMTVQILQACERLSHAPNTNLTFSVNLQSISDSAEY